MREQWTPVPLCFFDPAGFITGHGIVIFSGSCSGTEVSEQLYYKFGRVV
jgi:hypothetical protein